MRRILLASVVVLVCSGGVNGALAQGVSLGLVGGINQSSVSSETDQDLVKTRSGINVGAFLAFESSGSVGFQLGASYTAKGFDIETGDPDVSGGVKITYIEVPFLAFAKFPTGQNSIVSPKLYGGGAVAFKAGCDVVASGMGASASVSCDEGNGLSLTPIDVGVMFGGGLIIGRGSISVVLDVAYTLGLMNIDDTGGSDTVNNKNLSLSAGLVFPLGAGS